MIGKFGEGPRFPWFELVMFFHGELVGLGEVDAA
jgi:hypothetical protein